MQVKPARERVVIVTSLGSEPKLSYTDDEKISLAHLHHFLPEYDKFMLCPEGVHSHHPGYEAKFFDKKYFGSVEAHCAMQMSKDFFEAFLDYEYIFMYHLDSIVLSSDLEPWLDRGWDYIGAPWMPGEDMPWLQEPRVGNGGFTLFHVRNCLKVLASKRYNIDPRENLRIKMAKSPTLFLKIKRTPKALLAWFPVFNGVNQHINKYTRQRKSDMFWADDAVRFYPPFRVASVEEGLRFAFESEPRECLRLTGGRMPFGAHAWARYDRAFWEPHLLKPDGALSLAG